MLKINLKVCCFIDTQMLGGKKKITSFLGLNDDILFLKLCLTHTHTNSHSHKRREVVVRFSGMLCGEVLVDEAP